MNVQAIRAEPSADEVLRDAIRKRSTIAETLRHEPREKPALVSALSVSRSTVDRGIRDLRDAGLVERTDEGFATTVAGDLALDAYREFVDRTERVAAAASLLESVPDSSAIDPVLLRDCSIRLPETRAPENALRPLVEGLRDRESLRLFTPVVRPSHVSLVHERVVEGDLRVELVIERGMTGALTDLPLIEDELAELFASDAFRCLETTEDLPYGLWWMRGDDPMAGLVSYESNGSIAGVLTCTRDSAVEWCRDAYESYREPAEPISAAGGWE